MIGAELDRFQPRSDSPYWNESSYFSFNLPERDLSGFVYMFHRPNMKLSAGGVGVWDRSSDEIFDCIFYEMEDHLALPPAADLYDFTLDNGLTVECKEPHKLYHLKYDQDGCELDLTFNALQAPHQLHMAQNDINPGMQAWGVGHFDQAGWMNGLVTVEGERFEIDSSAMRDRSWGPRRGELGRIPRRAAYSWAVLSESSSFCACAASLIPEMEDPIEGQVDPVVWGWYTKDGVVGNLVSGTRTITERGPDGRPLHEEFRAVDDLGRELRADGDAINWLKTPFLSTTFLWWTGARWTFDGQVAYGEMLDYYTYRQNRQYRRALRAKAKS